MITREDIRRLAAFESTQGDAVTFYFQPNTPQNKSHRQEGIQVKDLVKNALKETEKNGKNSKLKADLERILEISERMHGNQGKAKAIFACSSQGIWHEFDVPAQLPETVLHRNNRFHLKPLTALEDSLQKICVVVIDRAKARLFDLQNGEVRETEDFVNELSRRGRSDGFGGFDGGHAERSVENEAMRHFQVVAEHLLEANRKGKCQKFVVGCHEESWPDFECQLHTYVRDAVVGRFAADATSITAEDVKREAEALLSREREKKRCELVQTALEGAKANSNGAVGLKRVLRSLEMGEVQTLLMEHTFSAPGAQCRNCGHLDMHMVKSCSVCGKEITEIDEIADPLIGLAIRNGADVVYVPSNPELQNHGNIAALLRFRAERNTAERLAG